MKVGMDLDKPFCVVCNGVHDLKAVIVDNNGIPASLTDLHAAFLQDPQGFNRLFHPHRTSLGRTMGPNCLPGLTANNVVLCIMHAEIRIVINILQYHLRAVSTLLVIFLANAI